VSAAPLVQGVAVVSAGGYHRGVNRRTVRIVFSGLLFALWMLAAVFVVNYDLAHGNFGARTIIVLIVTGFFAFMRVLRAWFNEPRSD
jgi:prepilin signal peptidase PulO-like enzyme (type II secretory pathway)